MNGTFALPVTDQERVQQMELLAGSVKVKGKFYIESRKKKMSKKETKLRWLIKKSEYAEGYISASKLNTLWQILQIKVNGEWEDVEVAYDISTYRKETKCK